MSAVGPSRSVNIARGRNRGVIVVLANLEVADKLGVASLLSIPLVANSENGEFGGLREANDLNRGGSGRSPESQPRVSRLETDMPSKPQVMPNLGLTAARKNTISSRSTSRGALQFWKLDPHGNRARTFSTVFSVPHELSRPNRHSLWWILLILCLLDKCPNVF